MAAEPPLTARELAIRRGVRSTLLGIVASAALAAVKGTAGVLGNSYALIADALESVTDIFTSLVVLTGLKVAATPPDRNHPYGHGKAEPIAAALVSIGLYGAAALIAVQAVREIVTPHHAPAPFTLWVLVAVVLVKETLFRHVNKVAEDVRSNLVRTDAWHHRSDALTSGAAFIGISVALIGGPGYEMADDWAALVAAAVIVVNATLLLRAAIEELTDAAPDPGVEQEIRTAATGVAGVISLDKCRVRKLGFDYFADLDVIVDGDLTVREGHAIAHNVQNAVREALPLVNKVLVHVEPHDARKDGRPRLTQG